MSEFNFTIFSAELRPMLMFMLCVFAFCSFSFLLSLIVTCGWQDRWAVCLPVWKIQGQQGCQLCGDAARAPPAFVEAGEIFARRWLLRDYPSEVIHPSRRFAPADLRRLDSTCQPGYLHARRWRRLLQCSESGRATCGLSWHTTLRIRACTLQPGIFLVTYYHAWTRLAC